MATRLQGQVLKHLRRAALLHDGGGLTDGELLSRFLAGREEAAFAALVRRHGPMVLGVCRRVLGNLHDAEDAFQATFLVLVRRAGAVVPRDLVGNWLYGVAYRTALEARVTRARRKAKERQVTAPSGMQDVVAEAAQQERLQLLDQELSRLPDRYRLPIVLCDLQGRTHREAARTVGCLEATLSTRLLRARQLLARRLTSRGLACLGGTLTVVLGKEAARAGVSALLVTSTIHAATAVATGQAVAAVASNRVAVLAEGVLRSMLLHRLKALALVAALVGLLALGAGLRPRQALAARPAPPPAAAAKRAPEDKGSTDRHMETLRQLEAVKWNLLRVDVGKRTLHIADTHAERSWGPDSAEHLFASADAQLSLNDLPVGKDARITLDGKEIPLKDLRHGVNLSLKFARDRPIVTVIEAKTPLRAGYVVNGVNADKATIIVTRGKDDKPLVLTVAPDALLTGINTLKDLKTGMHVAVHLQVEDRKVIVKDLRVR
ncbi:MAG TPA: sigma-70 family RNA polymerase sigma factor [Gemmataceae bacterium]|nr:sigma-70 family RNA polymerase sigma factor [Gemmataceae bacterium]